LGSHFFLLLSTCLVVSVIGVPKILFGSNNEGVYENASTEKDLKDYSEEELLKELSELVENLNDEQLATLEGILEKEGLDDSSEFNMITEELKEIGMDEEDIHDLKALAQLMYDYLVTVPSIAEKLELTAATDLQDHVQLYLLGLPNNLGPLGYIALHKVLEDEDEESAPAPAPVPAAVQTQSAPVTFRRRRDIGEASPAVPHGSPAYSAPKIDSSKAPSSSSSSHGASTSYTAPTSVRSTSALLKANGGHPSGAARFKFKVPAHSHKVGGGHH